MFIFSNLATSVDGKIATRKRNYFPLGTDEDRHHMLELRLRCDAVLTGAASLRASKKPFLSLEKSHIPVNIILSSNLSGISTHWDFFKRKDISRILFVGPKTPTSRIKLFKKLADVVILKPTNSKKTAIALQIKSYLEKKGIRRLLVEGGGEVMWNFASLNLIDEYHITLTPQIIGGALAPTLVDGLGLDSKKILQLKLCQCRPLGDELYLIYRNR